MTEFGVSPALAGAFANLTAVNADMRRRRDQRKQQIGANRGFVLGALGGALLTGGSPQGAAIGGSLGSSLGRGQAGGQVSAQELASPLFQAAALQQQQQAQAEREAALQPQQPVAGPAGPEGTAGTQPSQTDFIGRSAEEPTIGPVGAMPVEQPQQQATLGGIPLSALRQAAEQQFVQSGDVTPLLQVAQLNAAGGTEKSATVLTPQQARDQLGIETDVPVEVEFTNGRPTNFTPLSGARAPAGASPTDEALKKSQLRTALRKEQTEAFSQGANTLARKIELGSANESDLASAHAMVALPSGEGGDRLVKVLSARSEEAKVEDLNGSINRVLTSDATREQKVRELAQLRNREPATLPANADERISRAIQDVQTGVQVAAKEGAETRARATAEAEKLAKMGNEKARDNATKILDSNKDLLSKADDLRKQALSATGEDARLLRDMAKDQEARAKLLLDQSNEVSRLQIQAGKEAVTYQILSGETAQEMGFPEGTILQEDSNGKVSVLYKPDSNKPVPLAEAAKIAYTEEGLNFTSEVIGKFRNDDGTFNSGLYLRFKAPLGGAGTEARIARARIERAIRNRLRIESGAVLNSGEIEEAADQYMGNLLLDDPQTFTSRLEDLNNFFVRTAQISNREEISGRERTFYNQIQNATSEPKEVSPAELTVDSVKGLSNRDLKALQGNLDGLPTETLQIIIDEAKRRANR